MSIWLTNDTVTFYWPTICFFHWAYQSYGRKNETLKYSKIFVACHNGLVGGAIIRALSKEINANVITVSRRELDLEVQSDTFKFLNESNTEYGAEFLYRNLSIGANLIHGTLTYECAYTNSSSTDQLFVQFWGRSYRLSLRSWNRGESHFSLCLAIIHNSTFSILLRHSSYWPLAMPATIKIF